jgi:hypothetical protein
MKYRATLRTSYNARTTYGRPRLRSSTDYLNLLTFRMTAYAAPLSLPAVARLAVHLAMGRKFITLRAAVLKSLTK